MTSNTPSSTIRQRVQKRLQSVAKSRRVKKINKLVRTARFGKLYLIVSLIVLLLSVLLWSILSSRVQQANADQLIDAYFFQSSKVFHGAIFPNQHTFLFKWPLFYVLKLFGFSSASFIVTSVACVLATVGAVAWLLSRIERRPLVLGTILLALASVLIMVPTQPYPGALLPVNMAMVTTRNLEYVLYLGGLGLLLRAKSARSKQFWLAILVLGLLFASDKLFLDLGVAASIIALIIYALKQRWHQVSLSVNWLLCTVGAAVVATVLIALISSGGIAHTSAGTGTGPYGFIASAKNLVLGVFYAITGLFTNFGANPAYNATTLAQLPGHTLHNLANVSIFSYITNILVFKTACVAMYQIFIASFRKRSDKLNRTNPYRFSVLLIWTSLAALAAFILTNHYYVVDARYLSIVLFAGFVSLASYSCGRKQHAVSLVVVGILLFISVVAGISTVVGNYHNDKRAFNDVSQRNQRVAQVLSNHTVQVLVGDYWRVVPIKAVTGHQQTVMPLESCTAPREVLTSKAWQPTLHGHSFAYLLTIDTGLTGYRPCNLQQIINAYGKPNASALIAGTLAQPKELLLFYDAGIKDDTGKGKTIPIPSTVLPISLDSLPNVSCSGPTVMNIVAHEDDDLLFMNPDTMNSIKTGDCVRTVYITAGDSGFGSGYWLLRERGSEAAYAKMIGVNDVWIERIVSLSSHAYITVATSKANPKISLIFMHLPDGGIHGDGFAPSRFESLSKLYNNNIKSIQSVDNQSTYTSAELTGSLTSLMHIFQPAEIRTQSDYVSNVYPDHSDHMTVGRFTNRAYNVFETEQYNNEVYIPIKYYIGYPIHDMPANIGDADLNAKTAIFITYSQYDGSVCDSVEQCSHEATYGSYLARQYQNPF